jgi:hypothetical protein
VLDARIVITGIQVIEPALVGELTDDCPRVGPRIRRSLARKGQGWSASDDDFTLIEKVA